MKTTQPSQDVLHASESQQDLVQDLLRVIQHDVAKPQATVKMFTEILNDLKDKPEELDQWKAYLLDSFSKLDQCLVELQVLVTPCLERIETVPLKELFASLNQKWKKRGPKERAVFHFPDHSDLSIKGDPKLLHLLFGKFIEFAFVQSDQPLDELIPLIVHLKETEEKSLCCLEIEPSNIVKPSRLRALLPNENVARGLFKRIVQLHHGFSETFQDELGLRYQIGLPIA